MDRDDDFDRDLPAEGIGLLGRTLALVALGAVLMQAWRQLSDTHGRLHGGRGDGEADEVPAWEGDASGVTPGLGGGLSGGTTAGRRAAAGGAEVDDGLQPFGPPPTGVVPTTH